MKTRVRSWSTLLLLALALLPAAAQDLTAQAQGTLTGVVVDRATRQPLSGVQVFIEGTGIGGISNANGRYLLANVPSGEVTVTAQLIGYGEVVQTATAVAGQAVALNFELTEQALGLDEIIVTGTAGGTQRRAIGNVVDRVEVSQRAEVTASANVMHLLSAQTAGVYFPGGGGMVGAPNASPRIRGVSSLELGSNPILYVDGVRVNNDDSSGPNIRGGRMANRMNDINPNDIESIEIIKGPAAATLYGTEASAGVIQIITKKGVSGAPSIEMSVRQGVTYLPKPAERHQLTYWYHCPQNPWVKGKPYQACTAAQIAADEGVLTSMNIYEKWEQDWDQEIWDANLGPPGEAGGVYACSNTPDGRCILNPTRKPIFQNGPVSYYSVNIRGGTDLVRYFISGGYDDEEGIVEYNWNKRLTSRANVSVLPNEQWELTASLGYVQGETRFAQAASPLGIWEAIQWNNPNTCFTNTRCFRYLPPEESAKVDSRQEVGRFSGSFQINHKPFTWFDQRLTFGMDNTTDVSSQLWPLPVPGSNAYWGAYNGGRKLVDNTTAEFASVDYAATARFNFMGLTTATSAGLQYQQQQTKTTTADGQGFPATVITTVGGAAVRVGDEEFEENKTMGVYVQEQLGLRDDRIFLTFALRADANSAFGEEFDAAYYPKASGTWVLSDEDFFTLDWIDQFRVRSAYGKAGRQPGTFDAVTLYTPQTGPGGSSAITPSTKGNPALKPEVGEELELGFDLAVLQNRLSLEYTYYTKTTTDALLEVDVPPSQGFPGSERQNVGELHNWGHEVGLTANLVNRESVGFDLNVTFANQENEIVDLGDYVPTQTSSNQLGYPIGTTFSKRILSAEWGNAATQSGTPKNLICDGGKNWNADAPLLVDEPGGPAVSCADAPRVVWLNGVETPTWLGSVNGALRIGQSLRLGAVIEYMGGHNGGSMIAGSARSMAATSYVNPYRDARLQAWVNEANGLENSQLGNFDAGFAILREVSAAYQLPQSLVEHVGASRVSFTVAARNLGHLWEAQTQVGDFWADDSYGPIDDQYISSHPEYNHRRPDPEASGTEIPPTASIIGTLRVTF